MVIINEREIIKKIPIFVKKGKNKGRQTGFIYFERNKEPYYYITKSFRGGQVHYAPKHIGKLPISTTILEDLKAHGVKNIVFMIIGFDDAGSFYIVVPLSDYNHAPIEDYDDAQAFVWMRDYSRIYPEQGSLGKFIGV